MTDHDLELKSVEYRRKILAAIKTANAGHTGGSLSCVDILNVLYNRILRVTPKTFSSPDRDRYIQSKGHSVEALYVLLADKGFIHDSDLGKLCRYNSHFVGHPTRKIPGIEQNTGALGHGLSVSVGIALGGKIDRREYRVFTLCGDGELAEGSNWEASLSAAHFGLDNLTAIIDHNGLQITGLTDEVCRTDPLEEKFSAFGWNVQTVDGHSIRQLSEVLSNVPFEQGKPNLVIADTTKGKGISFMEGVPGWHHGVPDDSQFDLAIRELDAAHAKLNKKKESN